MLNSLIRQRKQIRSSEDYKDLNYIDGAQGPRELEGNIHDPLYAEDVKTLEHDLNNLRSQLRDIIGKGTWYAEAPTSLEEIRNVITQKELELKYIKEHEELYHHNRNENSVFEFNGDELSNIKIFSGGELRQDSVFEYSNGELISITKTIWDNDLEIYVTLKKNFQYDAEGILLNIENIII